MLISRKPFTPEDIAPRSRGAAGRQSAGASISRATNVTNEFGTLLTTSES